jgi:hypothetical protein
LRWGPVFVLEIAILSELTFVLHMIVRSIRSPSPPLELNVSQMVFDATLKPLPKS